MDNKTKTKIKQKIAVGLMSGTSMDGIDVAIIKTDGKKSVVMGETMSKAYSKKQKKLIVNAVNKAKSLTKKSDKPFVRDIAELITKWHCDALQKFFRECKIKKDEVDVIGFHGQTILHQPKKGFSIQVGNPNFMANKFGIPVVANFREADLKAGGEGAPLAPVFHQAIISQTKIQTPCVFVNVGGISNVTYVQKNKITAFDCGPGNNLIDQWVEPKFKYDKNGELAMKGEVIQKISNVYLSNPYFKKMPPKSLDRADFRPLKKTKSISLEDGARTFAFITAKTIASSKKYFGENPKKWIVAGGGRKNKAIMNELKNIVGKSMVVTAEEAGLNGDMIEAQAFAYLAVRSVNGLPISYPTTTGCQKPTKGGVLALPERLS